MKTLFVFFITGAGFLPCSALAENPLRVVTTLSSYADLAKTIGGDRIEVASVASPRFNPHFIEPRPSDVLKLKKADLFIHSGLDLEVWRGPLLDAVAKAEFREGGAKQLNLSQGIPLLEVPSGQVSRAEGDIHLLGNPHYWINPNNGLLIAQHICQKLSDIDPASASFYRDNLQRFEQVLGAKMLQWKAALAPYKGQAIVGYHNEWPYLMSFLGLEMTKFIEPKPGIPPGPQHLEQLVQYIKAQNAKAVVQTTYYSSDAGEFLQKKTGVKVLPLCQNVGELPECSDYVKMIDYAVTQIARALSGESHG